MKGNIFIKRPVMALSISILILIVGFISLGTLPVEQYPDIAPPTVRVEATYTGANAEAVMNSVIMPLEEYQWCGKHDLYHIYGDQLGFC